MKCAWIARLLLKHDTAKFNLAFRQEKETDTFLILYDIHQLYESRCELKSSQRVELLIENMQVLFVRLDEALELELNSVTISARRHAFLAD